MAVLLADFLRDTVSVGSRERIPLADELRLIERFLAIERVRFGDRLGVDVARDPAAETCAVPPLLLQPLVENAVTHGIAGLIEGGTIAIATRRDGARLAIAIENPCDPARRSSRGAGVGLDNVRRRLAAAFGDDAWLAATEREGRFRVELTLPVVS
jgi:LytS/YehU family sensor histidine kinase